jgi:hypothetical protein
MTTPDDRPATVLRAHTAALTWVRQATGGRPAPAEVATKLARAAVRLRDGEDSRDPTAVLSKCAIDALAAHRALRAA